MSADADADLFAQYQKDLKWRSPQVFCCSFSRA